MVLGGCPHSWLTIGFQCPCNSGPTQPCGWQVYPWLPVFTHSLLSSLGPRPGTNPSCPGHALYMASPGDTHCSPNWDLGGAAPLCTQMG